jgi:hypothetical protein
LLSHSTTTTAIEKAVRARTVPGHTDEQTAVVTKVGRPPVLRIGHQGMQILLQPLVVEGLEGLRIVEVLVHGVGDFGVLAQDVELQLIGPPVCVPGTAAANGGFLDGTFAGVSHGVLRLGCVVLYMKI